MVIISIGMISRYYSINKKTSSPDKIARSKVTNMTADVKIAAIEFYSLYESCLKQRSKEQCQKENPLLSSRFVPIKMTNGDMITCSDSSPMGYEIKQVKITNGEASATVIESFSSTVQTVVLHLTQDNNKWKVDKIDCPAS